MENRKRKTLSIVNKIDIIKDLDEGKSNSDVCRIYNLSSSTVSTIWKNRESIRAFHEENNSQMKKMRMCDNPNLDAALFQWFKVKRSQHLPISGWILQAQAEKFAKELGCDDLKCSDGWLRRFKNRHNISFGKVSGEAGGVSKSDVKVWLENVWSRVKNQYQEDDIFNIDETGLFHHLMPNGTLRVKGERCVGGKLSKERVTVLLGANMSGKEKVKLLVIGKSKNPRCFKGIKNLPTKYSANLKAWMTSLLFTEILREWDKDLRKKKRHILLLVDNCPAHGHVKDLTNITLMFFPPNVTSVLQPMDQGVIQSFKCHYRKKMIMKFLEDSDSSEVKKLSLLESMRFMAEAWDSVTSETIRNCFKKAGLVTGEDDDVAEDFSLASWLTANGMEVTISNIDEYVGIDDQIAVSEVPTDSEIVQSVQDKQDDSDDDETLQEEPTCQIVPTTDALSALNTLCGFYETNDGIGEEFHESYCKMKNIVDTYALKSKNTKQSSILDFLRKHDTYSYL